MLSDAKIRAAKARDKAYKLTDSHRLYPGLFAAYNAGPARYARHLRTGEPLARETRGYIAQLARTPATPSMPPAILSGTRLLFTLGNSRNPPPNAEEPAPREDAPASKQAVPGGLFAPLSKPAGDGR